VSLGLNLGSTRSVDWYSGVCRGRILETSLRLSLAFFVLGAYGEVGFAGALTAGFGGVAWVEPGVYALR